MLDRSGVELVADPGEQRLPRAAVVARHADLDQLVGQQVDVDLVQHGRSEPVLADDDEGVQVVRLGAKCPALGGC